MSNALLAAAQGAGKFAMVGKAVGGIVVGTGLLAGGAYMFVKSKEWVKGTARVALVHKAQNAQKDELACSEVAKTVTSATRATKGSSSAAPDAWTTVTTKSWRCLVDVSFVHRGKEITAPIYVEGEAQAKAGDVVNVEWRAADPAGTIRPRDARDARAYVSGGLALAGLLVLVSSVVVIALRNNKAAQTLSFVDVITPG